MKMYYETRREQVINWLEFIAVSKKTIAELQAKADKHPELVKICGEWIFQEKKMLNYYQERLKEAYALPNEEN